MKVWYARGAEDELSKALLWYECKRKGTGRKVLLAIEQTIQLIQTQPEIGRPCGDQCRKRLVSDYPFYIIYRIRSDLLEIMSVFNTNRAPDSWRKNLKN